MISRKKIIIFIIAVIVCLIFSIFLFIKFFKEVGYDYDKNKCYNLPETTFPALYDNVIIDCLNYINVHQDSKCSDDDIHLDTKCGDIFIQDSKNNNFVAIKVEKYKIVNDNFYIIGSLGLRYLYSEGVKYTFYHMVKNNEDISIDFKENDIIPKYIVINSQATDTNLYNDYSEMSEDTKIIFKELEKDEK